MSGNERRAAQAQPAAPAGQAILELALVAPLLLLFLAGLLAASEVQRARNGLDVAAREAARAAAQGSNGSDAITSGLARGQAIAQDYGLTNGSFDLTIDARGLQAGAVVQATARYEVRFGDLPLLRQAPLALEATSREAIDQYRSRGH